MVFVDRSCCFLSSLLALALIALTGCSRSQELLGGRGKPDQAVLSDEEVDASAEIPDNGVEAVDGHWQGYPDVPYLPITEEIAGIEIPRVYPDPGNYVAGGKVPVDLGNPAAKGQTGEPVTGGDLTIRFGAEPESLNPITAQGAYMTYVMSYVLDPLAWKDPETFEYEPYIAKKWIVEDSVKLRPDYPEHERRVKLGDGEPAKTLVIEIESDPDDPSKPLPVTLTVLDAKGRPVPTAWVGFTALEGPADQTNDWTNEEGVLKTTAAGIGRYRVRVGYEFYGDLKETKSGYLLVQSSGPYEDEPLKLSEDDVINVERKTVFTFFLRDDVTWSDGAPFTARDLRFAYAVINNPAVDGAPLRTYYANIVSVDELDSLTVRMKYREQYFEAFDIIADLASYTPPWHRFQKLVKKEKGRELTMERLTKDEEQQRGVWSVQGAAFAKFFNDSRNYSRSPLGTGPYVVTGWSEQDKQITLTRRNALEDRAPYWNDEKSGYLNELVFKFIEDDTTALQALKSGAIEFYWRVPATQFFLQLDPPPDWLKENYVKASWYTPSYGYIGWNLRNPLFQNRQVRMALAMLFDKQEFFQTKDHRSGVLTSGSQYYFGPAYDRSVGSVGYDPAAARELLADAGWIDTDGDGVLDRLGQDFRFTLLMPPGSPLMEAMVAVLQQSYRDAGIDMELRLMEWAHFVARLQLHEYDVVTLSWVMDLEGDPFQIWHSSQTDVRESNHVGFESELGDKLIEQIRVTLDDEKRKRLEYTFHRLLDRQQPYMFLWTSKSRGVYHQKFRGVKFYALRPGYDLREWWIPKKLQEGG